MNVYKDTELGRLPHDWDVAQLSDLIDPARTIRYGIVQPGEYDPGGRLLIRGQDYSKGWVDADEMFRVSSPVEERYINARVKTGDLVITIVGAGTGHIEEIPSWLDAANLTQTTARIAINPKKADSKFLKYMLLSNFGRNQVSNYVKGAAQPGLNCGDVERFTLPLPRSLDEQSAIGASLMAIDNLIASLNQVISKKHDIHQATLQQLLTGQRRLPGFSGEWKIKQLGDIASIKTGSKNNQDKLEDGEYPFYVRSATIERINSYSHECEAILVPGEGNIGNIFHYINGRFDVHQRVYAITQFADDVSGKYVHLYMSVRFGAHAMQNSVKATVDSLRLPTFQIFEVLLPPSKEEQVAIAEAVIDMEAELAAFEARRDKALQLKQGMMQELLTGRIRLSEQAVLEYITSKDVK